MSNNIIDIAHHQLSSSDKVFIDTNVLLSVYSTIVSATRPTTVVSIYSSAIRNLFVQGIDCYIDKVVLSEYINVSSRAAFKIYKKNNRLPSTTDYKRDFRPTAEFRHNANDIMLEITSALSDIKIHENNCDADEIKSLLKDFGNGYSDFNDQLIYTNCKSGGFILLTDDGDFISSTIDELTILTGNPRLLSTISVPQP